jgi:hypothetical protein
LAVFCGLLTAEFDEHESLGSPGLFVSRVADSLDLVELLEELQCSLVVEVSGQLTNIEDGVLSFGLLGHL